MKRNKIAFVYFGEDMSYSSSIFGMIASHNGWDVDFVYLENETNDEIIYERLIREGVPDIVAISFKTLDRSIAYQVAEVAQQLGSKIIAGGIHPTECSEDVFNTHLFDGIVIGDGMGVFKDIMDSFSLLKGSIIQGKRGGDKRQYVERLFSPAQIENIRQSKSIEILTSIGCPYSCHFCLANKKYMEFSLQDVVNEIENLSRLYDIKRLKIRDDTFSFNVKRIREFRTLLEERGLSFSFNLQTRANTFSKEIAEEMVRLGVEDLGFGIETISPKLLEFINKKIKVDDAYHAADICREYNLPFKPNFLFGIPRQDKYDYEATIRFVKDTKPDSIFSYYFMPFPGAYLYDYCLEKGHLPQGFMFDTHNGKPRRSEYFQKFFVTPGMLDKIDYDMASDYMKWMNEIDRTRKEEFIITQGQSVDNDPWIIFGTEDYFFRVAEILSKNKWRNYLGYFDIRNNAYQMRRSDISLKQYDWSSNVKPHTVVVTVHKGRYYDTVIEPILRNKFKFTGPIVSMSTFGRNEISKIRIT